MEGKKKAGRPIRSQIRDNIVTILSVLGPKYGYEIHKIHGGAFFPCTREVVYYHLRKGVLLGLFSLKDITSEGSFSWGKSVEKKVYAVLSSVPIDANAREKIERSVVMVS